MAKGLPFNKLSKRARQKALEDNIYLNVNHEWWDSTYEDAANIGLEITGFDLDRRQDIDGKFTGELHDSLETILSEHGEKCDTYQVALEFKERFQGERAAARMRDEPDWNEGCNFPDLLEDYEKALLKCYFRMLKEDYDYLTTDEAIIESIEANDYRFSREGEMVSP